MIVKNENNLLQELPLKQYESKPYDEKAAKKHIESLERLLPLLNEMEEVVKAMQAKVKEVEAARLSLITKTTCERQ